MNRYIQKPFFCIVLSGDRRWTIDAEWPDGTIEQSGSIGHELSKQQQLSDWGAADLSDAQLSYAAADVLYLHALKDKLDAMLARDGREGLAASCFRFLPDRVRLDLAGFAGEDLFAHS
jgi:ribonuclease D